MEVFFEHHRLAVDVDHGGLGTDDGGFFDLQDVDFGRLVHVLAQEIAAHDGKFQGIGFPDDAEVDLAVPQRSLGGDGYVVAHLGGVGKGDEEGLGGEGAVGKHECVFLLAEMEIVLDDVTEISVEAAMGVLGVVVGHLGVIARSRDADERHLVHHDGVDQAGRVAVDELKRLDGIQGDVETAGEAVARAAGNHGQGSVGADETGAHLIDGSVATRHRHDVVMLLNGFLCQCLGMAGIFGKLDVVIESFGIHNLLDLVSEVMVPFVARNGVDDEPYPLLAHVRILC